MKSRTTTLAVLAILAVLTAPVWAIDTVPLPESPANQVAIGTWPTPERVFFIPLFLFLR